MTRLLATLAAWTLPLGWLLVTAAIAWRFGPWLALLGVGLLLMAHGVTVWIASAVAGYLEGRSTAKPPR